MVVLGFLIIKKELPQQRAERKDRSRYLFALSCGRNFMFIVFGVQYNDLLKTRFAHKDLANR